MSSNIISLPFSSCIFIPRPALKGAMQATLSVTEMTAAFLRPHDSLVPRHSPEDEWGTHKTGAHFSSGESLGTRLMQGYIVSD